MEREDQKLLLAKEFFEPIGIECYDIILPINSDIYCVKRIDCQWAAFKIGNSIPIVPFGKYNHMWGYDGRYCLASVAAEDKTTFANRCIINEQGEEIIKPYTLGGISCFYGKHSTYIFALTKDNVPIDIPITLLKLLDK